jgi:hypothetical protein
MESCPVSDPLREALEHCVASLEHLMAFKGSRLEESQREGHERNIARARAALDRVAAPPLPVTERMELHAELDRRFPMIEDFKAIVHQRHTDHSKPCPLCGTYQAEEERAPVVERERDAAPVCPHVRTSPEGTSYCTLAARQEASLGGPAEELAAHFATLREYVAGDSMDPRNAGMDALAAIHRFVALLAGPSLPSEPSERCHTCGAPVERIYSYADTSPQTVISNQELRYVPPDAAPPPSGPAKHWTPSALAAEMRRAVDAELPEDEPNDVRDWVYLACANIALREMAREHAAVPPCPHVRTSPEGTSYCTLAESGLARGEPSKQIIEIDEDGNVHPPQPKGPAIRDPEGTYE